MMKFALTVATVLFAGCAASTVNLTPGEQDELAPAMASPLSFELSAEDSNVAWGRAQVFVRNVPGAILHNATDFVLDGASCLKPEARAHYSAERLPLDKEHARITINVEQCSAKQFDFDSAEQVERDAHIFAYFVRTGVLACDRGGVSACLGGYVPPAPSAPPAPKAPAKVIEGGGPPGCPGLPGSADCEQGKQP